MFNPNKITKILGATFVLVSSNFVLAETVSDASVSVTVQNAFSLVETTALSFGSVRAIAQADGANVAFLTLDPDGSTTTTPDGTAAITALTAATAGVFTVSGAAPFTDLTVTFPADFELISAGAPPTSPTFDILNADWLGDITGGADDGTQIADGATMQTDGTGDVVLTVGTKLTTDGDASTTAYLDAAYTANYTMDISY